MTAVAPRASKRILVRVAAALWVVEDEKLAFSGITARVSSLIDALNGDSRITATSKPVGLTPEFCFTSHHWPKANGTDRDVLMGNDALRSLQISTPVEFSVRVPVKNQPVVSGANDVPSDVYECAWDGETLAVGWEQDSQGMPLSGGHVAIDVLSDVLAKMGDSLYVQACSPGCHNQFVHQTIAVVTADSDSQTTIRLRDGQIEAAVKGGELDAAVWFVHNACGGAINAFAEAKGIYQRISDLELLARQNLDHLLGHYVEHAELAARPLRNTVRSRWRQRRWRREAQVLMANIFIALSAIETLKTQWADSRRTLRDAEAVALVEPDLRGDDHAIDKLDLSQVASATEHLATRIDNRAEVLATSVGALGGAVSGAAVSGVFALLQ